MRWVLSVVVAALLCASYLRADLTALFDEECGQSSENRYARECEYFSGVPNDQTYVCSTIEHCCFMSVRCFGFLIGSAVDLDVNPFINPLTGSNFTELEWRQYHSACPYPKCNTGYEFARECKGNPPGGYPDVFPLDAYSDGEAGPRPCADEGTCQLALPYQSEVRTHIPFRSLGECLEGTDNVEGSGIRNCMKHFQESARRCLKYSTAFLQGNSNVSSFF
mmetsp:Transcript_537/g.1425  ORF Transcript_537/g.1425 Transcript_537/m.1425 type:complete len:221 (-) Transcript_537:5055-5717(-)